MELYICNWSTTLTCFLVFPGTVQRMCYFGSICRPFHAPISSMPHMSNCFRSTIHHSCQYGHELESVWLLELLIYLQKISWMCQLAAVFHCVCLCMCGYILARLCSTQLFLGSFDWNVSDRWISCRQLAHVVFHMDIGLVWNTKYFQVCTLKGICMHSSFLETNFHVASCQEHSQKVHKILTWLPWNFDGMLHDEI